MGGNHVDTVAFGRGKRGIHEALPFIEGPVLPQRIRQLGEDFPQDLALTPLLDAAMDSFVVGIAPGEEAPLCAGVQNPEHRLQDRPCGDRSTARTTVRDVFFGEVLPNPVPLVIAQTKHDRDF